MASYCHPIASTSKDEIVSLVEAAQEKERSSGEHKAEMAFNLMDRWVQYSTVQSSTVLYSGATIIISMCSSILTSIDSVIV